MFVATDLGPVNTLGVPSVAARAVVTSSADVLGEALATLPPDERRRARVVGELSNTVLFEEVHAPLIVYRGGGIADIEETADGAVVHVEGSCSLDGLVAATAGRGLFGIEMLSGIPGTVGAGLVQNVGAYGQEIASTVAAVEVVDRATGERHTRDAAAMQFDYRTSALKWAPEPAFDVVGVELRLSRRPAQMRYGDVTRWHEERGRDPDDPESRRASVLEVRDLKGFVVGGGHWVPCNGSTFTKTVVPASLARRIAARLPQSRLARRIEEWLPPAGEEAHLPAGLALLAAGFHNGDRWGPVALGERHVLAICNLGAATGPQVWALAEHLRETVAAGLGIDLRYEVEFLGRRPGFAAADILAGLDFQAGSGEPDWVERLVDSG